MNATMSDALLTLSDIRAGYGSAVVLDGISFDLPEHRVSAQDAAVYARPGDTLELARKICELMDDPDQRARLGAIGRRRIDTELGWTHQAARLLELYADLCPEQVK